MLSIEWKESLRLCVSAFSYNITLCENNSMMTLPPMFIAISHRHRHQPSPKSPTITTQTY